MQTKMLGWDSRLNKNEIRVYKGKRFGIELDRTPGAFLGLPGDKAIQEHQLVIDGKIEADKMFLVENNRGALSELLYTIESRENLLSEACIWPASLDKFVNSISDGGITPPKSGWWQFDPEARPLMQDAANRFVPKFSAIDYDALCYITVGFLKTLIDLPKRGLLAHRGVLAVTYGKGREDPLYMNTVAALDKPLSKLYGTRQFVKVKKGTKEAKRQKIKLDTLREKYFPNYLRKQYALLGYRLTVEDFFEYADGPQPMHQWIFRFEKTEEGLPQIKATINRKSAKRYRKMIVNIKKGMKITKTI
jgi:hypothetical protein